MRAGTIAVVALAATGCRQALGIPSGGEVAGEDGFHVEAVVRGADGASNGAAVMLNGRIEELADGTITLSTVLPDGLAWTIEALPERGHCQVANGSGVIDGDDATGVEIACDGLAALSDPGLSAPADFGGGFDPRAGDVTVFGSILTQQTYLAPSALHAGTVFEQVGGQVTPDAELGYGPFGFASAIRIDTTNEGYPRTYTLAPTLAPPATFGYGKPSIVEDRGAFGRVVAMAGELLVVGAPARGPGRAFAFRRSGRDWVEDGELVAPGANDGDRFGASVAVLGDTIVVGAPAGAGRPGAIYVFVPAAGSWMATRIPGVANGDEFGAAVALTAQRILVGAPGARSQSESPAAGCVFQLDRQNPAQAIKVSSDRPGDRFGASLAADATRFVVGAPGDASAIPGDRTDTSFPDAGAAYVYRIGIATFDAYVKPPAPGADDTFGAAVAIDGDLLVVGAPGEDAAARGVDDDTPGLAIGSGAAFVFARAGTAWDPVHYLKSSHSVAGDRFGSAVAVLGNTVGGAPRTTVVAIGAPFQDSKQPDTPDDNGALDAGAVFAYALSPALEVTRTDYVKASNIGAGDAFGTSLALGVDALVVGAPAEDSSKPGWNITGDEAALDAGAVYAIR